GSGQNAVGFRHEERGCWLTQRAGPMSRRRRLDGAAPESGGGGFAAAGAGNQRRRLDGAAPESGGGGFAAAGAGNQRRRLDGAAPESGGGGFAAAGAENYVELHSHSAYSFLDGASLPEELVVQAAELGYEALALTDH